MTMEHVGIRKKGFAGSMNSEKPSLKIKLDKYNKSAVLPFGVERITLNNNVQDPSNVR